MSSWIPTYEQIPTSTMVPQHFDNYSSIDELFNIIFRVSFAESKSR